jgi:hypothetical protein
MAAKMTYPKAHIIVNICNKYINAETDRKEDGKTISEAGVRHWKSLAEPKVREQFPEFDALHFDEIIKRMVKCLHSHSWRMTVGKKVSR